MTTEDRAYLAGLFDCRGSITVAQSSNIIGTVTLSLPSELLTSIVISMLEDLVECKPAALVGKTYKLNFTSSRGTQLIQIMDGFLREPTMIQRAAVYAEIFPIESAGKHMKLDRLESYKKWLELLTRETVDDDRQEIISKLKG